MPKLSGVFSEFPHLDQIPLDELAKTLKHPPDQIALENFLANRILYPQAIPTSVQDLEIDLGILQQALKSSPDKKFYDEKNKKIYIPENYLARFPNLIKLSFAFIEAAEPQEIVKFVLVKQALGEEIGSFVPFKFEEGGGQVDLDIEGAKVKLKAGTLMAVPCPALHCHIKFTARGVRLRGKSEGVFEAVGGRLGLLIDGRKK